jgi:hypothetical protein
MSATTTQRAPVVEMAALQRDSDGVEFNVHTDDTKSCTFRQTGVEGRDETYIFP